MRIGPEERLMWGYQEYFRLELQSFCNRVLGKLDRRLSGDLFLVGLLEGGACVEPEYDFWLPFQHFEGVLEQARAEVEEDPTVHPALEARPRSARSAAEGKLRRALRELVRQRIESHPERPGGCQFFLSQPARVGDCRVLCVLSLPASVLEEYGALESSPQGPQHKDCPVAVSLIQATVDSVLSLAHNELEKVHPGENFRLTTVDEETCIRNAANRLCQDVVYRADRRCIGGIQAFLRQTSEISARPYEGEPGSGKIVLARDGHPNLQSVIRFRGSPPYGNTRSTRKLLQLCRGDLALHTNSEQVFGLCTVQPTTWQSEDLFLVHIRGHHLWELKFQNRVLMKVHYGTPNLPSRPFDEARIRSNLRRMFRGNADLDPDLLIDLFRVARQERHGTLLIVTPAAEREAARLAGQATPILPCRLTPGVLAQLTGIDGAILLSPNGIAFSIGTILDGVATEVGDPGRGARYNSALRYVQSQPQGCPCLAVVVSEDGGMDFFPEMRPAVSRSSIDQALAELERQVQLPRVSGPRYRKYRDFFTRHRFYLLPGDCLRLNQIIPELEERLRQQEQSWRFGGPPPFAPHPDFDPELHYQAAWHQG